MKSGEGADTSYMLGSDNLFLSLYRFVPQDSGAHESDKAHESDEEKDTVKKKAYLEALTKAWPKKKHVEALKALCERQTLHLRTKEEAGLHTDMQTLRTEGRFIAGLGYDSPLEVGMTLHPLHGFPYLPGSSVKGIARTWAERVVLEQGETTREIIRDIFGHVPEAASEDQQKGAVHFLDALPTDLDASDTYLELDVMTPHYGPYYTNDDLPGDWHQPVPVPFLTVSPGTAFQFALSGSEERAVAQAATWLKEALMHLGAGSKTRSGYGYFVSPEQNTNTPSEESIADTANPVAPTSDSDDGGDLSSAIEPVSSIGNNTRDIPVEVVDNSSKPVQVKVYAEGYGDETYPCGGINNTKVYPPGTIFYAKTGTYSQDKGLIMLSFDKKITV